MFAQRHFMMQKCQDIVKGDTFANKFSLQAVSRTLINKIHSKF
jgi:hypothetical protein